MTHAGRPSLSVVVPWRDRPEFAETIERNAAILPKDTQWIVVNGGGDREMLASLVGGRLATVVHLPMRRWAKGPVQNVGVSFADAERLLLLDCDIAFSNHGWEAMQVAFGPGRFVTLERVFDTGVGRRATLDPIVNDLEVEVSGRRIATNRSRYWPAEGARSGPGVVLLSRADFCAVGGFVGVLPSGLGFVDVDLLIRLIASGKQRVEAGTADHIDPHPTTGSDARRSGDGRNFATCLRRYEAGMLMGTYAQDTRKWLALASVQQPGSSL